MYENYNIKRRDNYDLARAYVPFQVMDQIYSPREALKKGTLFPELYRPYVLREEVYTGGRCHG